MKRYIVERTNKAEIRREEQSEKAENCREDLWNEIQLKGPQRQKETQEQKKKKKEEWASSAGLDQGQKPQHPHHVKVSPRRHLWRIWVRDKNKKKVTDLPRNQGAG